MKAQKRMSKKQIKGDRLVSTTFQATEYIQKNQTPFVIGAVALVVVIVLVSLLKTSTDRRKTEAAMMLSRAELTAAVGETDQYIADLRRLADDYAGTTPGRIATLRLGNYYFAQKQYSDAERYFKLILNKYTSDKLMAAGASVGLGAIYEIQGKYGDAAEHYRNAAAYTPNEIWTPGYLLKAGQNFALAGDKVAAEEAFGEIEKNHQNSSEVNAARRGLAELKY